MTATTFNVKITWNNKNFVANTWRRCSNPTTYKTPARRGNFVLDVVFDSEYDHDYATDTPHQNGLSLTAKKVSDRKKKNCLHTLFPSNGICTSCTSCSGSGTATANSTHSTLVATISKFFIFAMCFCCCYFTRWFALLAIFRAKWSDVYFLWVVEFLV